MTGGLRTAPAAMRLRPVPVCMLLACLWAVVVSSLSATTAPPPPSPPNNSTLSFIHISDIHFDPTYNPCSQVSDFCRGANILEECHPMGQYGCDSPETLVNSMIANMKQMVPNPAFIVVSGDSAAHDMTMADTLASIRYVMSSLQDAYPRVPLYPVIGNNDVYPKNSLPIGPSSYLSSLSEMLSSSSILPPEVWTSFEKGGYYSHSPMPGLLIVGINSIYWYKKWSSFDTVAAAQQAKPFLDQLDADSRQGYYIVEELEAMGINVSQLASDPAGQFSWLESTLAAAQSAKQTCILVWHVGLGTSATGGDVLWQDEFYSSFLSIMNKYHDTVMVMLSGHTHRSFFNLLYSNGGSSGDLIGYQLIPGSLTPRDLSNPTYRVFDLTANISGLTDFTQYVWLPSEATWVKYYQFTAASNGLAPTLSGLSQLYADMAAGKWPPDANYSACQFMNTVWASGTECFWSQSDQYMPCMDMFCSLTETEKKKFDSCKSGKPKSPVCPSSNSCNIAQDYCTTL